MAAKVTGSVSWLGRLMFAWSAVLLLTAIAPGTAFALTVTGPVAVFESGTYSVKWSSTDPTGTATVYRSGVAWIKVKGAPGRKVSTGQIVFPRRALYSISARLDATPTPVASRAVSVRSYARPGRAALLGIATGSLCGRVTPLKVRVDAATTFVNLFVNGKFSRRFTATPGRINDLGKLATTGSTTMITLTSGNPAGFRTVSYKLRLFSYPGSWHTCIVISTGKLRLYWIRNDVLVKSYPVATGRPSMPTPHRVWRIGAKYHTDPHSVYGPRKMRLFKKVGQTYQYTAYNVHGTNNQHSIGTYASHGCIRLYNHDILELFPQVPLYTLVQTRR